MNSVRLLLVLLVILFGGCTASPLPESAPSDGESAPGDGESTPGPSDTETIPTGLIGPADFVYLGAFRLPEGTNGTNWEYSGHAMTCYPDGNPTGPADGFPGSLFGTGHDWYQQISEISIPVPVVSAGKNLGDLNTATTLQPFHDIRSDVDTTELELLRAGLAYLPVQDAQTTAKLHFCWGQHFQYEQVPSHGWCELDLFNPQTAGGWYIGEVTNFSTNDYMFEIPQAWANAYASGMCLATGRFRDGGLSGQGPTLLAIGPWTQGSPPAAGTRLNYVTLLQYTLSGDYEAVQHTMNGYLHSDEWSGGAWLTAGDRAAVMFVGTKSEGSCWYGLSDGTVWPEQPPYPEDPEGERGWWSTTFVGRIILYDPADLAAVAAGTMQPHEPQPYASLDIDSVLFNVQSTRQINHVGACAFDRTSGILYVFEYRADNDKCLVHAWRVQ